MSKSKCPSVSELVTRSPIELFWTAKQQINAKIERLKVLIKQRPWLKYCQHLIQVVRGIATWHQMLGRQWREVSIRRKVVLSQILLVLQCVTTGWVGGGWRYQANSKWHQDSTGIVSCARINQSQNWALTSAVWELWSLNIGETVSFFLILILQIKGPILYIL